MAESHAAASHVIHPATRIGAVQLTVRNLERAASFYERSLGLTAARSGAERVELGVGGAPLVTLAHDPAARAVTGGTGLYHLALLVPSRAALAAALRRFAATRTPLSGASDHGVSEALYLADPEGNGIEIYRDRPRDEWPWREGRLAMGTTRLDLEGLLSASDAASADGAPAGTVIGHVHLRVSEIAPAEAFYCDVLGFTLMQRYGDGASFVAAGGYHHHIGFNTWESRGAPSRPAGAAGLERFEITFADEAARQPVVARLAARGVPTVATREGPLVRDPSGNALVLTVAS